MTDNQNATWKQKSGNVGGEETQNGCQDNTTFLDSNFLTSYRRGIGTAAMQNPTLSGTNSSNGSDHDNDKHQYQPSSITSLQNKRSSHKLPTKAKGKGKDSNDLSYHSPSFIKNQNKKKSHGKYNKNIFSGDKNRTQNCPKSPIQNQLLHKIDINKFEHEVLIFKETMKNVIEGSNGNVDINKTFYHCSNIMSTLAIELKICTQTVRHQPNNMKQRVIKFMDRGLHCLIQGVESLEVHYYLFFYDKEGEQNTVNPCGDKTENLFSADPFPWLDVLYIIEEFTTNTEESKKGFELPYLHDYFMILMCHMKYLTTRYFNQCLSISNDNDSISNLQTICKCLHKLVQGFGGDLHRENAIGPFVGSILIPLLEIDYLKDKKNIDQTLDLQLNAMECICEILSWKQHSSFILAPQVMDSDDRMRPNVMRSRLLRSLIALINGEEFIRNEHDPFLCRMCNCLYISLDKIYAIELSHKNKQVIEKNKLVIDHVEIAGVFKWVHKILQRDCTISNQCSDSLRWHSLRLLKCITKLYKQGCAQYWALFLPQTPSSPKKSNQQSTVTLISILSDALSPLPSIEEKIEAIIAAREIISSLPIDMWSQSGYLMNRVETSLSQFILCCNNQLMLPQPNEYIEELCITAKYLITVIPYGVYKSLVEPGIGLVSQVGEYYLKYEHGDDEKLSTALRVLADCFGGTETPQGELTPLPIPTEMWLRRPISSSFIDNVFNSILSIDASALKAKGSIAILRVNLITRMVRTVSWVVMKHELRLKNFVALSQVLVASSNNAMKLTGVRLISAFVEGKRNVSTSPTSSNTGSVSIQLIYQSLYLMLKENDSSIRRCTLTAYGNLQYYDWLVLICHDSNPLHVMLPLCLEYSGDSSADVRSEACRSIGNIITECLESVSSVYHDELRKRIFDIFDDVVTVTSSAVEDSSPGVRSMALFALGNIGFTINKADGFVTLRKKLRLVKLIELVLKHLMDDNDKVVGNSIRTLGHLCSLLFQDNFYMRLNTYDSMLAVKLSGKACFELSRKIELAIADVTDTLNQRSWRQRSFAKRHAWGACGALKSLLCYKVAREDVNQQEVNSAIFSLVKCIQYSQLLNEKIVVGAISTLNSVPIDLFSCNSKVDSLTGLSLAICLAKLETSEIPASYKKLIAQLMKHLVQGMNHFDMMSCLSNEELSQSSVQCLYNWMVENGVNASCFDNVAEALQFSYFSSDVSLIQKFRSRAEKKRRDELSSSDSNYEIRENDDEDEDEL